MKYEVRLSDGYLDELSGLIDDLLDRDVDGVAAINNPDQRQAAEAIRGLAFAAMHMGYALKFTVEALKFTVEAVDNKTHADCAVAGE